MRTSAAALLLLGLLSPCSQAQDKPKTEDKPKAEVVATTPVKVQIVFTEFDSEKKVKSLLYDFITKHLNLLYKQRSQELGLHLPEISRDTLCKKTQKAEKIYMFFKEIGLDKIKLN